MRRRWKANEKLQNILVNERHRLGRRDARRAQRRKFTFGATFMENDLKTTPSPNNFLSEDSSIIFDKIHVYFEKFAIFEY